MTVTQTLTIPADRRLTIDVPPDIPVGGHAVITFMPVGAEQPRTADGFAGESAPDWKKIPVDSETASGLGIPSEFLTDLTESSVAYPQKTYEFDAGKYVRKLLESDADSGLPVLPLAELYGERIPGLAKGHFWMADDFDAPLDDFKDYM